MKPHNKDAVLAKHTGIRTFEVVQYVSAPIPGDTIDDYPNNIQDVLYKALEKLAKKVKLPLVIVHVGCYENFDYDGTNPMHSKWYLWVVASEIVIDDRKKGELLQ